MRWFLAGLFIIGVAAFAIVSVVCALIALVQRLMLWRQTDCQRYGHIWSQSAGGLIKPKFMRCTRCGLDTLLLKEKSY
jgi:hypothetical protein